MTQPSQPCTTKPYYAMTMDPVHVGTGGYRLGRVDLSIVREPGTNIPKIPGTSLSGTTRAFAAMATGRYDWGDKKNKISGSCAGQGQGNEHNAGHCGSPYCPVCVAFGFARDDKGGFQGLAQFSDARILFFPVHSMIGPVWVTSPGILSEHGIDVKVSPDRIKPATGLDVPDNKLNLGWLMLGTKNEETFSISNGKLNKVPPQIKERAVLVSDKLFGQIVNSNLEVRTSVSIDPATGAAEQGALFTYEAIPRATVLWFQITYSNPKLFRILYNNAYIPPEPKIGAKKDGVELSVKDAVEKGLALLKDLGIGGMNTRGMGRLEVFGLGSDAAGCEESTKTGDDKPGGQQ
jgi:CRISPR-associated protein Cmr4